MSADLQHKQQQVLLTLREQVPAPGRLAVAFSGGADSTLLLALAKQALGAERVLAITADSASLPRKELEHCVALAAALGIRLRVVQTQELEEPRYRANSPRRCYHCKDELFRVIDSELRRQEELSAVAYGANADDALDHRPGALAAAEHQVLAPLAAANLSKAEVRELSQALELETWDKPARPCLSSRIPYGQEVSAAKLRRIEAAEAFLAARGLRELRVRHHDSPGGPLARIEVRAQDLPRLCDEVLREELVEALRGLGFGFVVLDLEGFRTGRLNEGVQPARRLLPQALGRR